MIESTIQGGVGFIRIRRPEQANALTTEMVRKFTDAVRDLATIPVVVISGEGGDFCLGRDRNEPKSATPYDSFRAVAELNTALAETPSIVIAAVTGRARGLGVGLVMRSDIAIAGHGATCALDEVEHGIPPMFIMAGIGDHLAPKHALDAVLTGRPLSADEALRAGMVSRVVDDAAIMVEARNLAAQLASRDPSVLATCKSYFRNVQTMPSSARLAFALVEQSRFPSPRG